MQIAIFFIVAAVTVHFTELASTHPYTWAAALTLAYSASSWMNKWLGCQKGLTPHSALGIVLTVLSCFCAVVWMASSSAEPLIMFAGLPLFTACGAACKSVSNEKDVFTLLTPDSLCEAAREIEEKKIK